MPSATPQHGLASLSERLRPATGQEGNTELLACLILVAPSGMTEDDRAAWLKAARMTLSGIPADLLKLGAKHARETCRFASEIVPAIIAVTKEIWAKRRRLAQGQRPTDAPKLAPPNYVSAEEARQIIAETLRGMTA